MATAQIDEESAETKEEDKDIKNSDPDNNEMNLEEQIGSENGTDRQITTDSGTAASPESETAQSRDNDASKAGLVYDSGLNSGAHSVTDVVLESITDNDTATGGAEGQLEEQHRQQEAESGSGEDNNDQGVDGRTGASSSHLRKRRHRSHRHDPSRASEDDTSDSSAVPNAKTLSALLRNENERRADRRVLSASSAGVTRRRARPRSSSSSTDEEEEGDDHRRRSTTAAASSSSPPPQPAEATPATTEVLAQKPPHRWNAPLAVKRRELGFCGGAATSRWGFQPSVFSSAAMGSLHMVERMELMSKLDQHAGCVNCLSFNQTGTRLCSGSDDMRVIVWDWSTETSLVSIDTGHFMNVFQAKFMPYSGDRHIVSCSRDGQVRLLELSSGGECRNTIKLAKHRTSAHKLALLNDSAHEFLSCGEDAVVFEIDLRNPTPTRLLTCKRQGRKVALYSVHSNPMNSNEFVICGKDQFVRVFDRRFVRDVSDDDEDATAAPLRTYCPHHLLEGDRPMTVTAAVYNFDGSEILATYNDEDIYSFDCSHSDGADYSHRYTGHRNSATVKGVNWYGPRSEFVVSGSDCGHVYFWEKKSEKIVQFMEADEGGVINVLEPHPTMAMLATSGLDNDVKIWVPSNESPKFDTAALRELMKTNHRGRVRDRQTFVDEDTDFIYYMLQRMAGRRRREERRRRAAAHGEEASSDDEEDNQSNNSTSDDETEQPGNDAEGAGQQVVQCRTS